MSVQQARTVSKTLDDFHGYREVDELIGHHREKKDAIRCRLDEFREVGEESDEKIFTELCFCLLTPQSKARICDKAIGRLLESGAIWKGDSTEVLRHLEGVRFPEGKARWIVAAREEFFRDGRWTLKERMEGFKDSFEAREWLVENILGLGYKEGGHFLRNVGKGEQLAILDRHIVKNLHRHGIIDKVPETLSKKEYLRIEALMKEFSSRVGIPLADLDLLFWSRETGEIFK
jgi:N-glycosylase/DNA lyase